MNRLISLFFLLLCHVSFIHTTIDYAVDSPGQKKKKNGYSGYGDENTKEKKKKEWNKNHDLKKRNSKEKAVVLCIFSFHVTNIYVSENRGKNTEQNNRKRPIKTKKISFFFSKKNKGESVYIFYEAHWKCGFEWEK